MVSLLLHGLKSITVSDVSCSWSKNNSKDSDGIQTIDEMISNDFRAFKDTSSIDFKGMCYKKLASIDKNIGFTGLPSSEPSLDDHSNI